MPVSQLLHAVDVPILVGIDANQSPGVPRHHPFGSRLHDELHLKLIFRTLEALRTATVIPTRQFNLLDKGMIMVGKRAELVLLSEDPTININNARAIERVWIGGIEILVKTKRDS